MKGVQLAKGNLRVLLAIGSVILGLFLAILSALPDIEPRGLTELSRTLLPFSERNESFRTNGSLAELTLSGSSCEVYATVLDEEQLERFLANGERPEAQLDCHRRVATFEHPLRWVILENRGSVEETLDLSAVSYAVRYPRSLLALLALPLLLGGSIFLILRLLIRGIDQLQDDRRERER